MKKTGFKAEVIRKESAGSDEQRIIDRFYEWIYSEYLKDARYRDREFFIEHGCTYDK